MRRFVLLEVLLVAKGRVLALPPIVVIVIVVTIIITMLLAFIMQRMAPPFDLCLQKTTHLIPMHPSLLPSSVPLLVSL